MIALIDYGVGNIRAFTNIYKKLDIPVRVAQCIDDLTDVTKVILPGVGAFDHAMVQLEESGMRQRLDELVIQNKVPVVGICVGMQMLAHSSDEGKLPGRRTTLGDEHRGHCSEQGDGADTDLHKSDAHDGLDALLKAPRREPSSPH